MRILEEKIITFGRSASVARFKKNLNGSYTCELRVEEEGPIGKRYLLNISPIGDTLWRIPYPFKHSLSDWTETQDAYYVITTDRKTMGGFTEDYMHKYDKTWKLEWTKKIGIPKYPDGNSFIKLTPNNQLLMVSDQYEEKDNGDGYDQFIAIRFYDLNGKLLRSNKYENGELNNPGGIYPARDGGYLISNESGDREGSNLFLIKIDTKGKVLWTKTHENFYFSSNFQMLDSSFIFIGSDYGSGEAKKINYHYLKVIKTDDKGNLLWSTELKRNYYEAPGNGLEIGGGKILLGAAIKRFDGESGNPNIFVLSPEGDFIFEHKFDFPSGIGSTPFLMQSPVGMTMITQKWIGKFGDPFHDVIVVKRLSI